MRCLDISGLAHELAKALRESGFDSAAGDVTEACRAQLLGLADQADQLSADADADAASTGLFMTTAIAKLADYTC